MRGRQSYLLTNVPEQGSVRLAAFDRGTLSALTRRWMEGRPSVGTGRSVAQYVKAPPALYLLGLSGTLRLSGLSEEKRFAVHGLRFAVCGSPYLMRGTRACLRHVGFLHPKLYNIVQLLDNGTCAGRTGRARETNRNSSLPSRPPQNATGSGNTQKLRKNGTWPRMVCTVRVHVCTIGRQRLSPTWASNQKSSVRDELLAS
ncbi:hypothetical protein V8C26DRAFT_246431 [Trichoderma gracile]